MSGVIKPFIDFVIAHPGVAGHGTAGGSRRKRPLALRSAARIAVFDRGEAMGVHVGEPVPTELRLAEVQGLNGLRRLGDFLSGPTLVVFLREFG